MSKISNALVDTCQKTNWFMRTVYVTLGLYLKKRIRYTNCLNFLVDAANLYFFILFFSTL